MFLEFFRRPELLRNFTPRRADGRCRRRFGSAFSGRCRRSPPPRPSRASISATLARSVRRRRCAPPRSLDEVFARIDDRGDDGVWIACADASGCWPRRKELERRRAAGEPLPLYGVPFAVKDNIDVAGLPTTAACPAFAYTPERARAGGGAPARRPARSASARPTSTSSPPAWSACARPTASRATRSTRATSRAAPAPARRSRSRAGLVSFALGTDTAGSGRVPAAFNNIVGLKPTPRPAQHDAASSRPAARSTASRSSPSPSRTPASVAERRARLRRVRSRSRARRRRGALRAAAAPPRFRFGVPRERGARLPRRRATPTRSSTRAMATLAALGRPARRDRLRAVPRGRRPALRRAVRGRAARRRRRACSPSSPSAIIRPVRAHPRERAPRFDAAAALRGPAPAARSCAAPPRRALARRRLPAGADHAAPSFASTRSRPIRSALNARSAPTPTSSTCSIWRRSPCRPDFAPTACRPASTLIGPAGSDARLAAFGSRVHRATSRTLGATGPQPLPARRRRSRRRRPHLRSPWSARTCRASRSTTS